MINAHTRSILCNSLGEANISFMISSICQNSFWTLSFCCDNKTFPDKQFYSHNCNLLDHQLIQNNPNFRLIQNNPNFWGYLFKIIRSLIFLSIISVIFKQMFSFTCIKSLYKRMENKISRDYFEVKYFWRENFCTRK